MSGLFHTARVKITRARKHISDIAPEMEAIARSHHNSMVGLSVYMHENAWRLGLHGTSAAGFVVEQPIPERQLDQIACCVGDAIHNLRSSLDLLACEVVERSGGNPKGVHFPMAETEIGLTEPKGGMIKDKKFNRATAEAQALLISISPHGEPHGNRLLRGLHKMDVIDKHQDILTLSPSVSEPDLFYRGARLPRRDEATPRLVFAPGSPFEGSEVVVTLNDMAVLTTEIVDKFSQLFTAGGASP